MGKDSQHFFSYARTHAHARTDTRLPHYSFVSRNVAMNKGARKNLIDPAKKVSRGRTEANACRQMENSQEVVALLSCNRNSKEFMSTSAKRGEVTREG